MQLLGRMRLGHGLALCAFLCAGLFARAVLHPEAQGAVVPGRVAVLLVAPMTGPYADIGNAALKAAQLAIDEANRTGGIAAASVNVVAWDCGPGSSPDALTALLNQRQPKFILEESCPTVIIRLLVDVAKDSSAIVIAMAPRDVARTATGPFYVPDLQLPGLNAIARYLRDEAHVTKVALLVNTSFPAYYAPADPKVWAAFSQLSVVAVNDVDFFASASVKGVARRQVREGTQAALLLTGPSTPPDTLAKAIDSYRSAAPGVRALAWAGPIIVDSALQKMPQLANGVVFPLFYKTTPRVAAVTRQLGTEFSGQSLLSVDVIQMWVAAARRAETLNPNAIAPVFDRMTYEGLSGSLAVTGAHPGRIVKTFSIVTTRDGKVTDIPGIVPAFLCIPFVCPCWPWC